MVNVFTLNGFGFYFRFHSLCRPWSVKLQKKPWLIGNVVCLLRIWNANAVDVMQYLSVLDQKITFERLRSRALFSAYACLSSIHSRTFSRWTSHNNMFGEGGWSSIRERMLQRLRARRKTAVSRILFVLHNNVVSVLLSSFSLVSYAQVGWKNFVSTSSRATPFRQTDGQPHGNCFATRKLATCGENTKSLSPLFAPARAHPLCLEVELVAVYRGEHTK